MRGATPAAEYFESGAALERWLEAHGAQETILWVGFYKTASGRGGITYPEALDAALCHGWIDGVRRTVDAERWTIRFTPRKPNSIWSRVNMRRARELEAAGRLRPAGLAAFRARREETADRLFYVQGGVGLDADAEAAFQADEPAWRYFQAQPPGYRRTATWWVMSAKKPETRQKRLATLIELSRQAQRIPQLSRTPRGGEGG